MKKLLAALTATAGALLWSAPAFAYRVEFMNMRNGQRVAKSDVCFFPSASSQNPFGHFLASDDVRCLSADDVIELPPGQWNYFGRTADGSTSAGPALMQVKGENQIEAGFRVVPIELQPGAMLEFSEVLQDGESLVVFLPTPFGYVSNVRPVTRGEKEVLVPADTPLVPMVVRGARPVRIGDVVTLKAGDRRRAVFTPPADGTGDAVVWLQFEAELARDIPANAKLGIPAITLTTSKGETKPLLPAIDARNSHLSFQIFRAVPAGAARAIATGDQWESAEVQLDVRGGEVAVAREPLLLAPAGTVHLAWRIDGDPAKYTSRPRVTCDGVTEAKEVAAAKRTLRILRCNGDDDCRVKFEQELDASATQGKINVASLSVGLYTAELHVPPFAPVREDVYIEPRRSVDTELIAAPVPVYGTVTRNGKPVRASLSIGGTSFMSEESGAFAATLLRGGVMPVQVTPCDTKLPFTYQPDAALAANAFLAIDIPDRTLAVRVIAKESDKEIADASVTVTIPDPSHPNAARAAVALRRDGERGLYVKPQFVDAAVQVCASAPRFESKCTELRAGFDVSEPVVLELAAKKGSIGRVTSDAPIADGTVWTVAPNGAATPSMLGNGGIFDVPAAPAPGTYYVLTSRSHPLCVLVPQPSSSDELVLGIPAAPSRVFAVKVASGSALDRGRVAVSIGGVGIPPEAFERHQQLRGLLPLLDGEHPLLIAGVAEAGAIGVRLVPLQVQSGDVPPPAGMLPKDSDLLLLR